MPEEVESFPIEDVDPFILQSQYHCRRTTLQWRHNGRDGVSITSLTIVYSTVYSGADQRKHKTASFQKEAMCTQVAL